MTIEMFRTAIRPTVKMREQYAGHIGYKIMEL